jgi:hypothetical protein
MDATTFTEDDIELTGAPTNLALGASGCTAGGTACSLLVQGVFTPGSYTIKLKKDAVINDVLGNQYTQATDRVIQFTVREAPPAPPAIPCLGA